MPIFQALGLGILILVLQSLAPTVLYQTESTLLAFLRSAELSANMATSLVASVGSTEPLRLPSALPDFPLPQVSQVRSF